MAKAYEVISKLTNSEIIALVDEFKILEIPEDALTRKVVLDVYGEIDILYIQRNNLLWTILEVVTERMNKEFSEENKITIPHRTLKKILYLSNTDHINDAHEMQSNLEKIHDLIKSDFPEIEEDI